MATAEDAPVTFDVLANDTDADGDALAVIGYTAPAHGTLVSNGGGSFTYTPARDFNGGDGFTYTVTDEKGRTATATVSIAVHAVNDAPVLTVPAAQTTAEDVAVSITGIAVTDVDVDEGAGLVEITLSVASGRLTTATGAAGGLTAAQVAGNGTGAVVLRGPIAAVNATLAAGIGYVGNLNFNGTDALTIVGSDLGNTGAGGALTDYEVVPIKVLSPAEIDALAGLVAVLEVEAAINGGQSNSLMKKLENAQAALAEGKPKVAYAAIGGFKCQVRSLVATGVLTPDQGRPLLAAADSLLQSLQIGGGF